MGKTHETHDLHHSQRTEVIAVNSPYVISLEFKCHNARVGIVTIWQPVMEMHHIIYYSWYGRKTIT